MKILIKTPSGADATVSVELDPNDNVSQLREAIESSCKDKDDEGNMLNENEKIYCIFNCIESFTFLTTQTFKNLFLFSSLLFDHHYTILESKFCFQHCKEGRFIFSGL
jgi:tRNA A22 N-methylase